MDNKGARHRGTGAKDSGALGHTRACTSKAMAVRLDERDKGMDMAGQRKHGAWHGAHGTWTPREQGHRGRGHGDTGTLWYAAHCREQGLGTRNRGMHRTAHARHT